MWARLAICVLGCAAAATLMSCMAQMDAMAEHSQPAATQPMVEGDPAMDNAMKMILDGQYADAAKVLERLAAGYELAKEPGYASRSLFWLGYCKEKTGNPAEASKYYRQVMDRYPQTDAARHAQDHIDGLNAPTP